MNDHHHGDSDHHHHGHEHHSAHGEMTVPEKLAKMVDHWIKHNADHAATYRQWAQRARDARLPAVADVLESVAHQSEETNQTLEKARQLLKNQ